MHMPATAGPTGADKMAITANQEAFFKAMSAAQFDAGCEAKPAITIEINGHIFTIVYRLTNRPCYDFLPTPTLQIKVDGKVVSYAKALQIAA